MVPPRVGTPSGPKAGRRLALWAAMTVGGFLPSIGCQVEYAGMTLPSGKYMYDDVQYFPPGPDFPWANTQAATQRARMRAMGMDVPAVETGGVIGAPPAAGGALLPQQNVPNMPTDVNQGGFFMDRDIRQPQPGQAAPELPADRFAPPGAPVVPVPAGEDAGGLPGQFQP